MKKYSDHCLTMVDSLAKSFSNDFAMMKNKLINYPELVYSAMEYCIDHNIHHEMVDHCYNIYLNEHLNLISDEKMLSILERLSDDYLAKTNCLYYHLQYYKDKKDFNIKEFPEILLKKVLRQIKTDTVFHFFINLNDINDEKFGLSQIIVNYLIDKDPEHLKQLLRDENIPFRIKDRLQLSLKFNENFLNKLSHLNSIDAFYLLIKNSNLITNENSNVFSNSSIFNELDINRLSLSNIYPVFKNKQHHKHLQTLLNSVPKLKLLQEETLKFVDENSRINQCLKLVDHVKFYQCINFIDKIKSNVQKNVKKLKDSFLRTPDDLFKENLEILLNLALNKEIYLQKDETKKINKFFEKKENRNKINHFINDAIQEMTPENFKEKATLISLLPDIQHPSIDQYIESVLINTQYLYRYIEQIESYTSKFNFLKSKEEIQQMIEARFNNKNVKENIIKQLYIGFNDDPFLLYNNNITKIFNFLNINLNSKEPPFLAYLHQFVTQDDAKIKNFMDTVELLGKDSIFESISILFDEQPKAFHEVNHPEISL